MKIAVLAVLLALTPLPASAQVHGDLSAGVTTTMGVPIGQESIALVNLHLYDNVNKRLQLFADGNASEARAYAALPCARCDFGGYDIGATYTAGYVTATASYGVGPTFATPELIPAVYIGASVHLF